MPTRSGTTHSTKRKKAEDMEEPPAKRVTRAQAAKKAVSEELTSEKPTRRRTASTKTSTTKKATDNAKASVSQPKRDSVSTGTARKTRSDVANEDVEELPTADPPAEVMRKVVIKTPSTRVGRRSKQSNTQTASATKTRGRSNRNNAPLEEINNDTGSGQQPETITVVADALPEVKVMVPGKTARTRNATAATKSSTSRAGPKTSVAKKVTFKEDADKENIRIDNGKVKKPSTRATGVGARPVRNAAASKVTTRSRRVGQGESREQSESKPLSPKKISQVAKAGSVESDDELGNEDARIITPKKSLPKAGSTPARAPLESVQDNQNTPKRPQSPSKDPEAALLASPARRLPASPFKEGLSVSPRKAQLDFSPKKTLSQVTLQVSPTKTSLFQESPRKIKLAPLPAPPSLVGPASPMRGQTLQSPARRPPVSPFKFTVPTSLQLPESPRHGNPAMSKAHSSHQEEAAASPVQAIRSPERLLTLQNTHSEAAETSTANTKTPISSPLQALEQIQASSEEDVRMNPSPVDETMNLPSDEQHSTTRESAIPFDDGLTPNSEQRRASVESASSDELASPDKKYAPTPMRRVPESVEGLKTPTIAATSPESTSSAPVSFTPLVGKLSGWTASSPAEPTSSRPSRRARGVFSIGPRIQPAVAEEDESSTAALSPAKPSFFEDAVVMMDHDQYSPLQEPSFSTYTEDAPARDSVNIETVEALQKSHESVGSEEYGDENTEPTIADMLREEQDGQSEMQSSSPRKMVTPAKRAMPRAKEIHTVSKVPLRHSADISPLKVSKTRSRSLGGPLVVIPASPRGKRTSTEQKPCDDVVQPATPRLEAVPSPKTPFSSMKLNAETPATARTVRKETASDVLKGAIVYVEVYTAEGADASSIFVDLLTQMGARCLKQWNWNPRASFGDSVGSQTSGDGLEAHSSPSASKIGITHVVYKDGGKRTLEKVKAAEGIVNCVGVGWVLDCEQQGKWLDEAGYAIDTSMIPRGGGRRRKSMEPRQLSNRNGSLVSLTAATTTASTTSPKERQESHPQQQPEDIVPFSTPASRRDTFVIERPSPQEQQAAPTTPAVTFTPFTDEDNDSTVIFGPSTPDPPAETGLAAEAGVMTTESPNSPTTPYYLSKGARLIQRTCPPKKSQGLETSSSFAGDVAYGDGEEVAGQVAGPGLLFPVTGNIDDQPDEGVRRRLVEARRKSLQWVSKTRSPLGKTVSYGRI